MKRGFYRVDQEYWPALDQEGNPVVPGNSKVLHVTTRYAYLHSALNPNPEIEKIGGELMGEHWDEFKEELHPSTADNIFLAVVERVEEGEEEFEVIESRPTIPRGEIQKEDVVSEDWRIPHGWGVQEVRDEQERMDASVEG